MFDIGFTELLVIFVVALLVVGPERLPGVARKIGLYIGKMRRSFQSIKNEVEQELEIEAVKAQLKENAMLAEAKELKDSMENTIGNPLDQPAVDEQATQPLVTNKSPKSTNNSP